MARDVDKRKTRKALRRLQRAAKRAEDEGGPGLTDWEKDFVAGVSERLEAYGSAFRDPSKGSLDEALSQRQTAVARALDRKARPRTKDGDEAAKAKPQMGSSFKRKAPLSRARVRDINADLPVVVPPAEAPSSEPGPPPKARRKPGLRVIRGGKAE